MPQITKRHSEVLPHGEECVRGRTQGLAVGGSGGLQEGGGGGKVGCDVLLLHVPQRAPHALEARGRFRLQQVLDQRTPIEALRYQ